MWKKLLTGIVLSLVLNTQLLADVLQGQCNREGARISTSWNSKVAYCRNGKYVLDFGGRVNSYVTVYANGKRVARIKVDRVATLNIDCK